MYEEAILKRGSVSTRGFYLRCAALIAILFIIVSTVMGQEPVPNAGSLQIRDESGKPAGECPLKHTTVKAEVSGFLSRVTVTQDFENPFPEKIEAIYTFPLPQSAAVDDLTMLIGDRTVKGKIMRREEAQTAYAAAKQLGKVAALLDQKRPNIFTQAVANIMPGQQIRIVISYVETLKYEDGSYEWSFPMVIAPRYHPATTEEADTDSSEPTSFTDRPGHDISIDLTLDAGVPIESLNSETHETEVERPDDRRAIVRLKDQNTIPNKDFVLKYQVAGPAITDAVLAHHSDRGGFFTLILQPPQRVSAEDVMPKELVFVIDTSGSMSGFPLESAKQVLDRALDTLYQHDTFNVIAFSGDTDILFSDPQPATPDNIRKAKSFLAKQKGMGGTEMMKAVTAALAPSDSQQHMRITCFLTDGQVGNDAEIIAEVRKYKNARVFAMGFGPAPNRYLLDNIAQQGRGEVDYVTNMGNGSDLARRFNERVRNPLLTDISIEWPSTLGVTDIYPKRIPDLFAVKPLIVSGRYLKGGKGNVILRGKLAGQDFVREIPVELPDNEPSHDVLATLWARRKIADVMFENLTNGSQLQPEAREEITKLGLDFKLMTQFTSFVAIDEAIFTGPEEPRRTEIPATLPMNGRTALALGANMTVTVTAGGDEMINQTDASLGTTLTAHQITNLPLQGRSFASLLTLVPGTVPGNTDQFANSPVSTNGQRATSNMYILDGVSANFGITPGGQISGPTPMGVILAGTASGGANGVASIDTTQEFTVKTSYAEPEYGRVPGAQVNVVTRAGTNDFHGTLFHFHGNDSLDANDWFTNNRGLEKPVRRLNTFGGTFGGPFQHDKLFFFGAYEGMRLRKPMTGITDVPSLLSRTAGIPEIQPFLNAFPLPTGETRPDGFAEFAATFSNLARHDVGSFRFDGAFPTINFTGKYNFADSDADTRGAGGVSLNTLRLIRSQTQMFTGMFTKTQTSTQIFEARANYSRLRMTGSHVLDGFGGAVVPASLAPVTGEMFNFDLNARGSNLLTADARSNIQQQFNAVASYAIVHNNHDFKFGVDYRRMSPRLAFQTLERNVLFDGVGQALTGVPARVGLFNREPLQSPDFNNLSLYGQDRWRPRSDLTLVYGVRWELNPPPTNDGTQPLAVDQVDHPAQLKAAAPGTSLWETTYFNLAPRFGAAYQLYGKSGQEIILRGNIGVHYDLGQEHTGDAFADSLPFVTGSGAPAIVFDPHLELPYTLSWLVSLERALGTHQSISASYVSNAGRRLLHTQTLFDQNPDFPFLRLTTNAGRSDYRALQVEYKGRFSSVFASSVFYTWGRSLDNVSEDSARNVLMTSANPALDRGPSDFDARHQLSGVVNYYLPAAFSTGWGNRLTRNWAVDSIVNLRSAKPVNVVYMFPTSFGVGYFRPDLIAGEPQYIFDPALAGGRMVNPDAFVAPVGLEQGNLGRNSLRGFPVYQFDLALRRRFNFNESVSLQLEADAFNLFNHPNFEDPIARDRVLGGVFSDGAFTPNSTFGRSFSLLGQSLSGSDAFGSFYSTGGSRAMRLSVKFMF